MKVVCVNLGEHLNFETCTDFITIGKSYEVIYSDDAIAGHYRLYTIKNDLGRIVVYNSSLFISIEEWRNKQLDAIGI